MTGSAERYLAPSSARVNQLVSGHFACPLVNRLGVVDHGWPLLLPIFMPLRFSAISLRLPSHIPRQPVGSDVFFDDILQMTALVSVVPSRAVKSAELPRLYIFLRLFPRWGLLVWQRVLCC